MEEDARPPDRTSDDKHGGWANPPKQEQQQWEGPRESIPDYSTLKLQQGAERQRRNLRAQETYVAMLEQAQLDLDAVAAHQRKTGVLQLYSQG